RAALTRRPRASVKMVTTAWPRVRCAQGRKQKTAKPTPASTSSKSPRMEVRPAQMKARPTMLTTVMTATTSSTVPPAMAIRRASAWTMRPGSELSIGPHPQPFDLPEQHLRRTETAAGGQQQLRQRQPFEGPGGAGTLLLVQQRVVHRGQQRCAIARQGDEDLCTHRIDLVRHRGGAAATGKADFGDRILRHQRNVGAELAEAAREAGQPVGKVGQGTAVGVPLRRVDKAQFGGEATADGGTATGNGVERPHGTAKLQAQKPR